MNIVNNRIKMTNYFHVFATKLHFIMYGKSNTLFLPLSLPYQTHTLMPLLLEQLNLQFHY